MDPEVVSDRENYALSLFALVDRDKVDASSQQMPELAEQLQAYLSGNMGIDLLDCRIEVLGDETYLVLNGVAGASLPAVFALSDVQKTQLFRYRREDSDSATLTPLAVDPSGGNES